MAAVAPRMKNDVLRKQRKDADLESERETWNAKVRDLAVECHDRNILNITRERGRELSHESYDVSRQAILARAILISMLIRKYQENTDRGTDSCRDKSSSSSPSLATRVQMRSRPCELLYRGFNGIETEFHASVINDPSRKTRRHAAYIFVRGSESRFVQGIALSRAHCERHRRCG